jgi:hypothetical protein
MYENSAQVTCRRDEQGPEQYPSTKPLAAHTSMFVPFGEQGGSDSPQGRHRTGPTVQAEGGRHVCPVTLRSMQPAKHYRGKGTGRPEHYTKTDGG